MAATLKPIFLLADSQLLFWYDGEGKSLLGRARAILEAERPRAAYLGASNGDVREFYELFVAAMAEIGIQDCRQIPSQPAPEDLAFLDESDLILLAGGDVKRGWTAFEAAGLQNKLMERYYAGAILVGVSAGAVQLGLKGWTEDLSEVFDTLRLVPFVVDAHDEPSWQGLYLALSKAGEHARGFGIPAGGGAVYHPDYSVEPVRHPLTEVEMTPGGPRQSLLLPGSRAATPGEDDSPGPKIMSQDELLEHVLADLEPESGDPVH